MKKFLLSLVGLTFGLTGFVASADDLVWNTAPFANFNGGKAGSSYSSYSTGEGGWAVTNSQIVLGSTYSTFIDVTTTLPVLNGVSGGTGTLTSPTLSNGIGTLKFNWGFPFSDDAVNFTVNIKQDGEVVKSKDYSGTKLAKSTKFEFENNFDIQGDFVIEILNTTNTSKNGARLAIWNLQWTNCETALEDPELEFSNEVVNVTGLVQDFEEPTLTKKTDGELTWASDNEKVATVTQEGKVTIVNFGSARITVKSAQTSTYSAGEATYTVVVTPGTISVEEAMNYLSQGLDFNASVSGYVVKIGSFNSTYGSLTYWIADSYDASTTYDATNSLQVYGGLWKEGAQFTGTKDLTVGATITVQGDLTMYQGNTPEFAANSVVTEYDDTEVGGDDGDDDDDEPTDPFDGYEFVTFNFTDPTEMGLPDDIEVPETANGAEFSMVDVTLTEFPISMVTTITNPDQSSANATNARMYCDSSSAWSYRFYSNNTFTVSAAEGVSIVGIVFNANNLGNSSIVWTGEGVFSNNVWTSTEDVEVSSVECSKTATGNNPSISTMTVYYDAEGGTNEVNAIEKVQEGDGIFYNLQGIKVNNPVKGQIYIVNGKKVIF